VPRADSRIGRLVLALAAAPPDAPPRVPRRSFAARLLTALAARPQPYRPPEPAVLPRTSRAGWLPALTTACFVGLTCLAATAAQGILPVPWQHTAPERQTEVTPERWRLVSGGILTHEGAASAVAFTPDLGDLLVVVARNGTETWDMVDPEHPERILFHQRNPAVTAAALSPDGDLLVTADARGLLGRQVDTGLERWLLPDTGTVKALQVDRRRLLFAVAGRRGATTLHDARLGEEGPEAPRTAAALTLTARAAQFSPSGDLLAVAAPDGSVRLWNVSDPARPRRHGAAFPAGARETTALAFSPDGRLLAAVGSDHVVRLWDLTDPTKPRFLGRPITTSGTGITRLAFSPDARLLATVNADGTTSLWWR
jgi:WD40 repeat protein